MSISSTSQLLDRTSDCRLRQRRIHCWESTSGKSFRCRCKPRLRWWMLFVILLLLSVDVAAFYQYNVPSRFSTGRNQFGLIVSDDSTRKHRRRRGARTGSVAWFMLTSHMNVESDRESTTSFTTNDSDSSMHQEDTNYNSTSPQFYQSDEDFDEGEHEDDKVWSEQELQTYRINLQLAQLARESNQYNASPAYKAFELFRAEQAVPDTIAYNSVLNALARASSSYKMEPATMAQELLEEMEDIHQRQFEENNQWYDTLAEGNLSQEEVSAGPPRVFVKPNVRSYSIVMDAWAKQGTVSGAKQALTLLDQLHGKYDYTGDLAYQPNVIAYNTVINAWAKAGAKEDGARQCESLLDEMGPNMADVISYNAALNAWARSGLPNAGEHAEALLRSMSPHVQPNARSYTTVIDAWSRSYGSNDSANRAHALLTELEELSKASSNKEKGNKDKNDKMAPTIISYSCVMHAYAMSKTDPFKAYKAFQLLQHVLELSKENPKLRPNRVTYNCVLNACATSCPILFQSMVQEHQNRQEKRQDLDEQRVVKIPSLPEMVRLLYRQFLDESSSSTSSSTSWNDKNKVQPDDSTFGTVLKSIANLFWGEPDQLEFCEQVFRDACEYGFVSNGVMIQLRQAAPVELIRSLLPAKAFNPDRGYISMKHLPKEWTRNLREDRRRRVTSR